MRTFKLLFLFTIILLLTSCKDEGYEPLQMNKQIYAGNQLRTDGYYYSYYLTDQFSVFFLYRDGTFLHCDDGYSSFDEVTSRIYSEFINDSYYKNHFRDRWGLFTITDNKIEIERIFKMDTSKGELHHYIGEIVNDTTFQVYQSYEIVDGQNKGSKTQNSTYHFKAFSPKPDSTNIFIK